MVLTTFGMNGEGNVIWYPSLYDADSCLGLTNDGELRYGSGIDTLTDNFNTSNSRLWTKLNEAFPDEIQARYIHMRSNGFMTYENIIKYYENVADTIGQTFYNEDARIKYINEDNKGYIYMCNGSRLEHTKRWISERIIYMDSKFNYGDWLLSSTIRSNVTGEVKLKVKTYSPQWVEISFSDSSTGTVRKWCDKDKWYEFTNNITNAVDNNITIRGITNVMYLQGLENLNVSSLLMSNAKGLCEIDIHGSKRIQRLELGNNVMLQKLNCKDCVNLGYDDNYKIINLEKSINLKYLDLSGTMIGTVQLNPDGGSLEFLDLSKTEITYLNCNHQEYLPEIKLDGCRDLSSISIRGCNALTRLSLPNTKLSSFRVEDCANLEYLDISYTGYLTELSLAGCSNLKTLKMSGVSNSQFTELDARTLTKLETLDVSKCDFLSNVRFAEGFNSLKSLDVQQSGIRTFQFGYEDIPNFLNLTPFTLNDLNFYNCTQVEHIKGLTLYATKSITPFYNCINLHTIEGSVNLTGAMGRSFYGCGKLTNFPTMDLSRVTSAGDSFAGCRLMTYQQMLNILSTMTNCEYFHWTFSGCSGINSNGEIKKEIFANMGKAKSLQYTFSGTNITGQLEVGVFDNLTNAVEIIAPFGTGQRVTGYIPANLLKYNTELVTFADVFNGSSGLEVATNIDTMFLTTTKLENIYGLFAYCNNAVMTTNENWFANCPKLKNVDNAFVRCYNLMGELKPWFANNPNLVTAHNTFQECTGLSGSIPSNYFQNHTLLSDIHHHFYKCTGLTGSLQTTLWENCPNLVDASYFLSGCSNLGGDASNQQEIPADFFKEKYRLVTIEGIVQGCSSLIFKLQPKWFKDCRSLTTISYAFDGCTGMSGEIPSDIFETHDAEGNIMDTVISGAKGVFKNCLYLYGTIPGNLFEKFLKVRDLSEFFYSCRNLEGGIPDELFANCYSLVYLNSTFYQCCKLGKYDEEFTEEDPYFCSPNLLLTCTNLQEVNNTWDMYWYGTSMRGEIPPDLFKTCKKLKSVASTWSSCSKLTGGLSGDLFKNAPNLQNASGTFRGCSGLDGEISGSLFSDQANPKLTTFVECFRGDSKLRGYAPTLWSQFSNADRTDCFDGCTSLANYAEIPDAWK